MAAIIDGYCHCGMTKYRPLADVRRIMDHHGVGRAVLVQHLAEYDNAYIESIVAAEPQRYAGVFLVDTEDPSAVHHVEAWAGKGVFRGIRLVARTLTTRPDVWEAAAACGLHVVLYDDDGLAPYADRLEQFAREHADTVLVLSHLGQPDTREAPHFRSHGRILAMARHANIVGQISGFHMFAEAPYDELRPLVRGLHDAFGPERLLYGSNFPAMKDDAIYGAEIELIRTGRLGLGADSVEQIMVETAMNLWFGPSE